jgi:RNA polymerase sigma factor (sigma-70 family)
MLGRGNARPSRPELERVALDLLQRRGGEILATARRYSSTAEDAEDAYQRALEILITKAPTTAEDELVPWLKTVVKHEAFSIRRQRERAAPVTDDGELRDPAGSSASPQERSERYERLRQGAEALGRLKPQEVRALLLKAEGYSYREICAITGWTYTKVNRCLTEGRKAFVQRLARIEEGSECERLLPLVSALADGEASADELRALRPHLKTCLACRARLREFRATPRRVAALLPPLALAAGAGRVRSIVESLVGAAQHKAAALGERAHTAAELATGQKVAAVAATAAAMASGGAGVKELAATDRQPAKAHHAHPARVEPAPAPEPAPRPVTPVEAPKPPPARAQPPPAPQPTPAPQPPPALNPAPPPPPPPPNPAAEFAPAAGPASAPAPAASERRAGGAPAGAGSTEFGP